MKMPPDWDDIPPAIRKHMGLTREQFDGLRMFMEKRDAATPAVGMEAPEFELRRIDRNRGPLDEHVRLSSLRGRPVALAFGSYT